MSDNLRRIVLPTIYDYFSKPRKKRALQYVAWWGNSFEKWLQWKIVFALEPVMQKMKGNPWDYEKWRIEHRTTVKCRTKTKRRSKRIQWDMVMLGVEPLYLQFKVCCPCGGIPTKFWDGANSLTNDVRHVRRFRRGSAAALLFVLEHEKARIHFEHPGVTSPAVASPRKIELGRTWCEACGKDQKMWARIYHWTNDL